MGKMILDQGVMKKSTVIGVAGQRGGRVIVPGSPDNSNMNIGKLESILKGDDKPSFCIIRSLGGIGDVLMTTPLARGLKRKWPGCTVTYATDMDYMNGALPEILKYNPYIDEVIPHQIVKGRSFDATTNVTSTGVSYEKKENPPVNRVDLFSHGTSIPLFGDKLPIYIVTQEEKQWAKTFLSKYIRKDKEENVIWIGIQARSNAERRNMPIENVKLLAAKLASTKSIKVVVFDSKPDEQWNLSGIVSVTNFKIRQVGALIDAMDLMICHDSGLLHIAGALEKRIVGLFGSTDPRARINYYKNAIAVENSSLQCLHCWYASCPFAYLCMKSITVEEVYNTVIKHLGTVMIQEQQNVMVSDNLDAIVLRRDVGGFGDMIMITPALKGLRERFKGKEVHLMIPEQYKDVFLNNPNVDRVIPINKPIYNFYEFKYNISDVCAKYEYSKVKDQKQVDKSRIEIYCEHTGVLPSKPELFPTEEEIAWAKKFLNNYKDNIIIATAIRSADTYRDWPLKYYKEVFKYFEKDPEVKFLILDKERKWDFPNDNIIDGGGFPFRKYISLVNECDLALTPDTSLLHIAGAFDKPTVALFGPIDYRVRCNLYPKTQVLSDKLDCVPCWRNSQIPCKVNNSLDESVCMTNIIANQVIQKLKEMIIIEKERI